MVGGGKFVRLSLCVLFPVWCLLGSRHYFGPLCQCVEKTVFSHDEVVTIPM